MTVGCFQKKDDEEQRALAACHARFGTARAGDRFAATLPCPRSIGTCELFTRWTGPECLNDGGPTEQQRLRIFAQGPSRQSSHGAQSIALINCLACGPSNTDFSQGQWLTTTATDTRQHEVHRAARIRTTPAWTHRGSCAIAYSQLCTIVRSGPAPNTTPNIGGDVDGRGGRGWSPRTAPADDRLLGSAPRGWGSRR